MSNYFEVNCCSHVSVWQRIYQQEIEVLLTRDQKDWEQYMKELLEKEVRIIATQTIKHTQTRAHEHSHTNISVFAAEGDATEEEESGELRAENPQPHVGQHVQVQPHPDRTERSGSGLLKCSAPQSFI